MMTEPRSITIVAKSDDAAAVVTAYDLPHGWPPAIRDAQGWHAWGLWCRDGTLSPALTAALEGVKDVELVLDTFEWRDIVGWQELLPPDLA